MDTTKGSVLEALEKYKGIVSTACASIGLARSTYYDWYNKDEEFKSKVDEIADVALDFVEGKLFEKINGVMIAGKGADEDDEVEQPCYKVPPSDTAIIFYLKTKGKKRGYIEKTEVDSTHRIKDFNIKDLVKFED